MGGKQLSNYLLVKGILAIGIPITNESMDTFFCFPTIFVINVAVSI